MDEQYDVIVLGTGLKVSEYASLSWPRLLECSARWTGKRICACLTVSRRYIQDYIRYLSPVLLQRPALPRPSGPRLRPAVSRPRPANLRLVYWNNKHTIAKVRKNANRHGGKNATVTKWQHWWQLLNENEKKKHSKYKIYKQSAEMQSTLKHN